MSALVAYRDLAADAVLSGGNAQPGFPLENMQTRQLSTIYRTSSLSTTSFTADLGAVRDVRVVALLGTSRGDGINHGTDLVVEYSRNGSTWFTSTLSAGIDAGVPSLPGHLIIVPVRPVGDSTAPGGENIGVSARYVRISPMWAQVGLYKSIGRLWISDALVFPEGLENEWELSFQDPGRLDFSDGQQAYEETKARVRVLRVGLPAAAAEIAFGFDDTASVASDAASMQGLQMEAGATGTVLVIPRTASALWARRLSIYGHIDPNSIPTIRKGAGDAYSTNFSVVEER